MEIKLELKHIAPYLPHQLKIQTSLNEVYELEGLVRENAYLFGLTYPCYIFDIKPILRPMPESIIPYNGLPIDEDGYIEPNDLFIDGNGAVAMDFQAGGQTVSWPIEDMQLFMESLFSKHFDVFGLIEKGLAVDINTISYEKEKINSIR